MEIYYRTQISYNFALEKCMPSPHDQHYNRDNFYNKQGYDSVMNSFNHNKTYYNDSFIIKHHNNRYEGKLPLWAMVEMMSFSNLSKLYSAMYYSEQNLIAEENGTGAMTLKNHLHCISVLRNKCAHAARLFNTQMNPPARLSTRYLRNHPEVRGDTVFAYILVLLKRLPDIDTRKMFNTDISALIEEFKDDIDLSLIGFPTNYALLLSNL